ncbi:MAG: hypothetical protein CEE42_05195 [Promethearchaeota archaeon Loki_b31]|nr:MAG: hypothetical protein CEE42_05195 [Candidatus Lokiarchaeota archaeon Loki_b31]
MSGKGVVVKVEYHTVGMFYTVRGKRISDIRSLKNMQSKIMSVTNAKWKWHAVFTFSPESFEVYFGKHGELGTALTDCFNKLRNKFWGFKYFWKYEEGTMIFCKTCDKKVYFTRDKEREGWVFCNVCKSPIKGGEWPHYHVLFDFINRTIKCKKDDLDKRLKKIRSFKGKVLRKMEYVSAKGVAMVEVDFIVKRFKEIDLKKLIHPKSWDKMDWKKWFATQYGYAMNKGKSRIELLLGYYFFKKWGNGIAHAREIMHYMNLEEYVKKDFYKYTESKYLKPNAKKWYNSLNVDFDPEGEVQGEWEKVLETVGMFPVGEALYMVMASKDEMVDYYNSIGKVGAYIYKRVIDDIKNRMVDEEGLIKDEYLVQKTLREKY